MPNKDLIKIRTVHPLLTLIGLWLWACQPPKTNHPGIALSFDDHFIKEWHALRPLLKKHQAKVTFFITCPQPLFTEEIQMLRELSSDGHEIGFHGTIHGKSTELIEHLGPKAYKETELNPGLSYLHQAGFHPTAYAHPGGNHNARVDSVLFASGFRILRDVSLAERSWQGFKLYHISPKYLSTIYYDFKGKRLVDALLIDTSVNLSYEELKEALQKARQDGTTILLFGHKPLDSHKKPNEYGFDINQLEEILNLANELSLPFYTMSELPKLSDHIVYP
ncbi:MAG: polysaccharide deacetylase family protein [Siphonobacter sp.]